MPEITWRQDKFARNYATSGIGTQSAIAAGYSVKTAKEMASENLTKPHVAKAIAKYRARIRERLDISREKIVNDAAHDAEQASAKGQYLAANAARNTIARMQGYIIDKSVNVSVDMTASHLDALNQLLNGRAEKASELVPAHETAQQIEAEVVATTTSVAPDDSTDTADTEDDHNI